MVQELPVKGYSKVNTEKKEIMMPLCKNTSEIYHINILIVINIIYHIYIEIKLYQLAYRRGQIYQIQNQF